MKLNKRDLSLFFIIALLFFLIQAKGLLHIAPGDENVYYYMGKLISEGKVPYKDFFYAHPPLHIYIIALIYKLFGFNIIILKLIPLISTLISAKLIFCIAKNKFGYYEAVISSVLFLFSYSIMFNSTFSFGIELATMFLVIGVYFLWNKDYYALAGMFFAVAGITRLLSLVPIFTILIIVLLSDWKKFLKLSSVFLIVFLLVNGVFILLFGNDYVTPVYKFHLLKSLDSRENFKEYTDNIKLNWILFTSAVLIIFVKEKKQIGSFVIIPIVYLIFLMSLKRIFGFYFVVAFPFLAIVGGYSVVNLSKFVLPRKPQKILLIVFFSIFIWNFASDILFLEKIGFTGFERGNDLADFVVANSNKDSLLFGDDSVAPLLALMTNKKIALDFVDTNNQVFISGVKNLSEVLDELNGRGIIFVIRSIQGISYFSEVKEFLNKNCEFLSQFHEKLEGDYLVYRCK